jgi:hypothetical protein
MLYTLMLLGIGFLSACVLMVLLVPLVHERAVRLTVRRLSRARPRSAIDRRAHEDQLRAQFAVSVLRLETALAESQAKTASEVRDVAKQLREIERLKVELRRTNLIILRFQARELMRRSIARNIVRLVVYLFVRWQRHGAPPTRGLPGREVRRSTLGTVSA